MKKFDFWIVLILVIVLAGISKGFSKRTNKAETGISTAKYAND